MGGDPNSMKVASLRQLIRLLEGFEHAIHSSPSSLFNLQLGARGVVEQAVKVHVRQARRLELARELQSGVRARRRPEHPHRGRFDEVHDVAPLEQELDAPPVVRLAGWRSCLF